MGAVTEIGGVRDDSRATLKAVQWTLTTADDEGQAWSGGAKLRDKSVQVAGTFGSGTVTLKGSNDGVNYVDLKDPLGNTISFTAAGLKQVLEFCRFYKPVITGSTDAEVTVTIMAGGGGPY